MMARITAAIDIFPARLRRNGLRAAFATYVDTEATYVSMQSGARTSFRQTIDEEATFTSFVSAGEMQRDSRHEDGFKQLYFQLTFSSGRRLCTVPRWLPATSNKFNVRRLFLASER